LPAGGRLVEDLRVRGPCEEGMGTEGRRVRGVSIQVAWRRGKEGGNEGGREGGAVLSARIKAPAAMGEGAAALCSVCLSVAQLQTSAIVGGDLEATSSRQGFDCA
jgi:hypothetical protein